MVLLGKEGNCSSSRDLLVPTGNRESLVVLLGPRGLVVPPEKRDNLLVVPSAPEEKKGIVRFLVRNKERFSTGPSWKRRGLLFF